MVKRANRGFAWLIAAMCLAIGAQVRGQGPADMPKVPILEGTTYAVIRLDLNKLDGNSVTKWLLDAVAEFVPDPNQKQQAETSLKQGMDQMVQLQQAMIKAGAPVVYFAFNEFPPNNGPLIYAPLAPGGNADVVRAIFYSGPGGTQKGPDPTTARPGQRLTAVMPEGVFMGTLEDYQRIKDPHIGAPHLLFALSVAPAAPLQAVAAPTDGLSLMLETMQPQVPPPVDLPMATFTRGVSSATATMQSPPDGTARIVIQAADAATAAQLKGVGDKMLAMLNTPQMKQQAPPGLDLQAMMTSLSPKVQENQVIIELAGAHSSKIPLALLLPALAKSRQAATTVQAASMTRMITMEIMRNAQQNQGTLPDTLDKLAAERFGGRLPPNPRAAAGQPGYVYVKAAAKLSDVKPTMILVYENIAALPPGTPTVNAGFGDGHVESMPVATLQQRLTAQGAPPPGR